MELMSNRNYTLNEVWVKASLVVYKLEVTLDSLSKTKMRSLRRTARAQKCYIAIICMEDYFRHVGANNIKLVREDLYGRRWNFMVLLKFIGIETATCYYLERSISKTYVG